MQETRCVFFVSGVTGVVVKTLAEAANAELYEIKPAVPYTDTNLNWMEKKSRSTIKMQDKNLRPEMADMNAPVADADVVLLVSRVSGM